MGRKSGFSFKHVFRADHFRCFHVVAAFFYFCTFFGVLVLCCAFGFPPLAPLFSETNGEVSFKIKTYRSRPIANLRVISRILRTGRFPLFISAAKGGGPLWIALVSGERSCVVSLKRR